MDYLYKINYQFHEEALSELERRALFGQSDKRKVFFSKNKINPSSSPFIKLRLDIEFQAHSLEGILNHLENQKPEYDEFRVDYIKFDDQDPAFKDRRNYCKSLGMKILSYPNFENPSVILGISYYQETWYYGKIVYNNGLWRKHNKKPFTYSSSIGNHLAKALVNIATKGDLNKKLIDPCCGVGTVLLEAAFMGYHIVGCDIMEKVTINAKKNMDHFAYHVDVIHKDIQDLDSNYDAAIVDLPYGICSRSDEQLQARIIKHAQGLADRVVFLSQENIMDQLNSYTMKIVDHCQMKKGRNHKFMRYIWVCE